MLPLTLDLIPSRLLVASLIHCHCLSWAGLIFSSLSLAIQLPLSALLGVSLLFNYARFGNSRNRWFINRIDCSTEGQWTLRTATGMVKTARLVSSYVHPRVVILSFATAAFSRYPLVILPDCADPTTVRRLRIYLQHLPVTP